MDDFKTLFINTESGICQINGKDMKDVSELELCYENGKWSLRLTQDLFFGNLSNHCEN